MRGNEGRVTVSEEQMDEKAHDYREGFVQGAKALLKIIGDDLPEQQMRVLERWVDGPLSEWRHAPPDAAQPTPPMIDGA